MKTNYLYNGHTVTLDTKPTVVGLDFTEAGIRISCPTCSVPFVVCKALMFAWDHNIQEMSFEDHHIKKVN